ncbi:MAG TPA: type II toxin-antitoxin system RelE/ParE family toxin [Steroidobacteraceae bacterium]|nr:type II toxin-antitoxin system RelE/ParE family toxin [Steroidobacteraceae bacterium]
MALPVKFTFSALRSIEDALAWWSRNRDKAPHALAEDLEQALALISSYPQIGTRARHAGLAGVRRVYLSRIRYHLYYRVAGGSAPKVEVLAFWHSSRIARSIRERTERYAATELAAAA